LNTLNEDVRVEIKLTSTLSEKQKKVVLGGRILLDEESHSGKRRKGKEVFEAFVIACLFWLLRCWEKKKISEKPGTLERHSNPVWWWFWWGFLCVHRSIERTLPVLPVG